MLAELVEVELQLAAGTMIIWNIEEYMDLLVDVFDVVEGRERDGRDLAEPLDVGRIPKGDGEAAFAVATAAARFLEVGFRAVGDVEMDHKTDVGLIDAHAECIGTYHDPDAAGFPLRLSVAAGVGAEACMVERR